MPHQSKPKKHNTKFEINCLDGIFRKDQNMAKSGPCNVGLVNKSLLCSTMASLVPTFHPMEWPCPVQKRSSTENWVSSGLKHIAQMTQWFFSSRLLTWPFFYCAGKLMYNSHPPQRTSMTMSQDLSPTTPGTLPFDHSKEHFRRGEMGHRTHCPLTGTAWLFSNTSEVTCWSEQEKSIKSQISCWHSITLLKT